MPDQITEEETLTESHTESHAESYKETLTRIQKLPPQQKILLAHKGTIIERRILGADSSIDVLLALVNSPKVTEPEIERFASLPSTQEVVLKTIYSSPRWGKSMRIRMACLKNSKLPMAIGRRLLGTLANQQLKALLKDPLFPQAIREEAKRMMSSRSG